MSYDPSQTAKLAAFANRIHPGLDRMTYYQLLNVPPAATVTAIRASFYQAAGQVHPDKYHSLPDEALKERLETIYARITEGYRVLTTPEKRHVYDKMLAEGKGQVRFDQKDRENKGPKNPEDSLTHAEAKKFFRMGMICLGRKDWKGAVMNLNFARTFEPAAPIIAEKLAEAQAGLGPKGPGNWGSGTGGTGGR